MQNSMLSWTKLVSEATSRKKPMAPFLINLYIMLRCRSMKKEKGIKCVSKDSKRPPIDAEVGKKKPLIQPSCFSWEKLQVLMTSQYTLLPS